MHEKGIPVSGVQSKISFMRWTIRQKYEYCGHIPIETSSHGIRIYDIYNWRFSVTYVRSNIPDLN